MAKKTEEKVTNNINKIIDSIHEKYGNVIITGDFLKENTGRDIPTGLLSWDIAFNGGIREGTVVHVGGVCKAGKTSLFLTFAAQAQKMGKNVYFIDAEGRLQPELLDCIEGLDKTKFNIIKSSIDKPLTAEDYLSILENLLKDDPGCFIILDSLAALCSEAEFTSEMADQQRAVIPKLMYKLLRKIIPILSATNSNLCTITHLQANPSGYGSPFKEVGGNAIQFFASYWMTCVSVTNIDNNGKKIGKDSKFKVMAVASGPPDAEPIAYIRYGFGCDKYIDLCAVAQEMGIIQKGGAWYTIQLDSLKQDDKYPKFQGEMNLCQYLRETPKAFAAIEKEIRQMVFGTK